MEDGKKNSKTPTIAKSAINIIHDMVSRFYRHYDGDTAIQTTERNRNVARDYRHGFQDKHCQVHFCHKQLCPICPLPDAIEEQCGDSQTWLEILQLNNLHFTKEVNKQNQTYTWKLSKINPKQSKSRLYTTL